MNIPLTGNQVEKLPVGYHITRTQIGMGEEGPLFYPNRKQRRLLLKQDSGKNKDVQKVIMRVLAEKYRSKQRDVILKRVMAKVNGEEKELLIVQRTIFHIKNLV